MLEHVVYVGLRCNANETLYAKVTARIVITKNAFPSFLRCDKV